MKGGLMKRKVMRVGLAMLTGLPCAVWAKGLAKEEGVQAYRGWNGPYAPHYGNEAALQPLMSHLAAPVAEGLNSRPWRLQWSPPAVPVLERDSPMFGRDSRLGLSLKLNF